MNTQSTPPAFLPGRPDDLSRPLERYLPPIPQGVAASWLEKNVPRGGLILDPFGAAPSLAIECARSGYRLLAAVNNPVLAFLLKMKGRSPHQDDLKAALAKLSAARLRDTRLEPYIRSQYRTRCRQCNREIMADAFLWERDAPAPYNATYTCPHCQDTGEYPTNAGDKAQAERYGQSGLHRSRALERVAPLHDPDRTYVEEALDTYPNRALHILSTLINKLEGLSLPVEEGDLLAALALTAFDQANTLWPHPVGRERPKQLTIPPKYGEKNLWLALERAVEVWASPEASIPVLQHDGNLPARGSVAVFDGRAKDLARDLGELPVEAVVTALPRPNQAFWTLSALWAGWLWGAEAVQPIKAVLRRARYSWRWHASALHSVLASLAPSLPPETPIFSLIGEAEPGFLSAATIAAHQAGLTSQGIALRPEVGQAQLTWKIGQTLLGGDSDSKTAIQSGAKAYLKKRGEPSPYLPVLAAGLRTYSQTKVPADKPSQTFQNLQDEIEAAISYRGGFLRLGAAGKSRQSGFWWLQDDDRKGLPLADQTEMALVRFLLQQPGCPFESIDEAVCEALPGLMTPSRELVQVCLESYGSPDPNQDDAWRIRPEDQPAARREDLEITSEHIDALGKKLDFATAKKSDDPLCLQWYNTNGEIEYLLYLTASAVLGKIIPYEKPPLSKAIIILPGGRANLVAYKRKHNPLLRQQAEDHYQFVKYRHLRHLLENPFLSPGNLDDQLALDPLTYTEPQIRLF